MQTLMTRHIAPALAVAALTVALHPAGAALSGADVAIYNDGNAPPNTAGAWQDGITAIKHMVTAMGMTWEEITYTDLNVATLDLSGLYQMLIMPGGYAQWYNYWISKAGKSNIRDFVANGGGYFGICAGSFFACDRTNWEGVTYDGDAGYNAYGELTGYDLDLFAGVGTGPLNDIAEWGAEYYNMHTFWFLTGTDALPDFEPRAAGEDILYYGGPWFAPDTPGSVETLATYDYNDEPAAIAFEYEAGRVVLFGPHPEIQEDSDTDGVTIDREDEMDDKGSDWELVLHAFNWLTKRDNVSMQRNGGQLTSYTSQYDGTTWAAENLVDGVAAWDGYMWCSAVGPGAQTFVFELAGPGTSTLDRAVIHTHAYYDQHCRSFTISTSTDGSSYTPTASGILPYADMNYPVALGDARATHVKLDITDSYDSVAPHYWQFGEFEVFGVTDYQFTDRDGDNLGDTWEMRWFGSLADGVSGADSDGDTLTNEQEFRADTIPTNDASCLEIDSLAPAPGSGCDIGWQGSDECVYAVDYCDGGPTGAWHRALGGSGIVGTNGPMTFRDAVPASQRSYRLITDRAP